MMRKTLALLGAFAVLAAACGDGESTTTTAAPPPTTEAPATTAAPATTTAPQPVTVSGIDYAFENLPPSVAAGTTLAFENASDVELHELVAILLPEDETRSAAELLQLPPEELGPLFADPAAVLIAPPGAAGFPAVGTGQLDEAGRYLVFCAIPIGIDPNVYIEAVEANTEPGPPVIPDAGPPHFTAGMVAELTVTG